MLSSSTQDGLTALLNKGRITKRIAFGGSTALLDTLDWIRLKPLEEPDTDKCAQCIPAKLHFLGSYSAS